jgi:small-conductance mechanosensitive channel
VPLDHIDLFGISLTRWLLGLAAFAGLFALLLVLRRLLVTRLSRFAEHTPNPWDDLAALVVRRTRALTLLVMSVWPMLDVLDAPPSVRRIVWMITVIVGGLQLATWGDLVIRQVVQNRVTRLQVDDPASASTLTGITFLVRGVLWLLLLLLALDNLGINISALVAGLGIGGVAIALATQNILSDLFASLSIVLDKPFIVGDFIVVGDMMGTVEHIGLKTTRLKSLSGEQLIFANADLLQSRIRNYRRMAERRVQFTVGVAYSTPAPVLARIPDLLREILGRETGLRIDRVHFRGFDEAALSFELVYIFDTADYNSYMDAQQRINLAILERFDREGIKLAYPRGAVLLREPAAPSQAPRPTPAPAGAS